MNKLLALLVLAFVACGDPADDDLEATPTPSATPASTPTSAPTAQPTPKPTSTPRPQPTIGGGQFVNNPDNSRGTVKIIWPTRYTDRIVNVTVWGSVDFFEELDRKTPNEYNDRERYYGNTPLKDCPAPIVVGALLTDGNRVCVTLADPEKRVDYRLD